MPASYLPTRKVLQSSANLVLRRQPNLFCSHGFFLALPQSATVSKYYQLENIYFQTGSPRRFNHTCSVPSVTSDYQFYLRTGNSLFQESTKGSQTFKFLRSMVSALSSLSCKSEFGVRDPDISTVMEYWAKPSDFHKGDILRPNRKYELPSGSFRLPSKCHENAHMLTLKPQLFACGAEVMSGLCQRSRRKDLLVMSTLAGHNRNLQYGKRVSGCLRNREPWGNNMFYKCFWSDVSGSIWNISHHSEPCMKNFSSSSTPCSTGAVPNASIDGVSQEKQLENSGASSDQKLSGDRTLKLLSGSCYLPHPEKEETGGEDAHFISTDQAIGVADGVGGWADLGVDAGQYARELMSHSVSAISEEPKGSIDPARVLEKAYISTKARGSSTACIVALTNQGVHAVNLGDSGFIIVRDGCAVFRSPVQQHDFNFTYQLESGNASDLPSSGQVFSLPVMAGDVIVAGTDGLFDNLYSNEVTAVVVHAIKEGLGPQLTAQRIAALARQCALDRNRHSPFSAAAQEAGYRYYGGKLDDITVVVSYVTATST